MTDLPAPVQTFIDATNRGDTEAFVAVFTDDAHVEDWGRVFRGQEGARSWNASDNIGKRSHFDVLGVEREGDDYVVTVAVTGDGFTGTSPIRFAVDGDRISRMVIAP